ncbi:MAG TPA: hypothetical protein VEZ11_00540 [Thermoanaerobaculia bacterium]|nr:hypothetical protein [Thermoanaerobaculia bacterium]
MKFSNRNGGAEESSALSQPADAKTRQIRIAEIAAEIEAAATARIRSDAPAARIEPPDERAIARKYGVRELVYPDSEQVKALIEYLDNVIENGRSSLVPKTAVLVVQAFLQGTLTRQNITKGPRMSPEEFDALQAPYYIAARITAKVFRERKERAEKKGGLYETTYLSVSHFADLLANLLDPGCKWLRTRTIPADVLDLMESLREFLLLYPEMRRKGRAV